MVNFFIQFKHKKGVKIYVNLLNKDLFYFKLFIEVYIYIYINVHMNEGAHREKWAADNL